MPVAVAAALPAGFDLRRTASAHAVGRYDPTTRVSHVEVWRAARTPHGPGTLHLRRVGRELVSEAWGPGAEWLLAGVRALVGLHRATPHVADHHPLVTELQRRNPGLCIGASRSVFATLVAAVLAQRVTGGEAIGAWRQLCRALGEPAPGPAPLLLPPSAERLAQTPSWWFHRFGVERRRAETIIRAARVAHRLDECADLPIDVAHARLGSIQGVGAWTVAEVAGPALGDLDAVPIGDYHIPHVVSYALAGEPRGSDERMIELLSPWAGVRGVVLRLLALSGITAPAFGPRRRIMPIARL